MAKEHLYFELTTDPESLVKIMEFIPAIWTRLSGVLRHFIHRYPPGKIFPYPVTTERCGYLYPPGKLHDEGAEHIDRPELIAQIMLGLQRPQFVRFVLDSTHETIAPSLVIARKFMDMGYRGHLHARNSHAECDIRHCDWTGGPTLGPEEGKQPARLRVTWNPNHEGALQDITPLVQECSRLNLKEYTPVAKPLTPEERVIGQYVVS